MAGCNGPVYFVETAAATQAGPTDFDPLVIMILEVAILDVIPGRELEFEDTFVAAGEIIRSMPGYRGHHLKRCVEKTSRYVLLVNWERLEDHTEGFRKSPEYQKWQARLHHFYAPMPLVEHYRDVFS